MNTRIPDHLATEERRRSPGLKMLALGLACLASPLLAEDPLLGRIKTIKCVGCNPGEVKLIVHDPIDVRDYEVRIKEIDYQKIIAPLAGKTIYDKGGCFYWMNPPEKPANQTGTNDSSASDTAQEAVEPEGTPSRCIPFERVQENSSGAGGKRENPEE